MDHQTSVWRPHGYQHTAEKFIFHRTIGQGAKGGGALFLDPGLGKTSICLSAISSLRAMGYVKRVLIVAPLRVCQKVWPHEIRRWSNFNHLSHCGIMGDEAKRRRNLTLPTDIHIINRENVDWLSKVVDARKGPMPWDMIIFDESTSFKTWSSIRSKAARKLAKNIPYRLLLTGTPSPKDLGDLFPQIWLLDEGAALGENITKFREEFCVAEGNQQYTKFRVRKTMQTALQERISPMCLRLEIQDYLSMPEITYHDVMVDLPKEAQLKYDALEREMFTELSDGAGQREISNAGVLYNACKQVANGGLYDNDRKSHHLHDEKIKAARELLDELQGKPAIIAYQFEHDVERLRKEVPGITVISGGMKAKDFEKAIDQWNSGTLKVPYLAVQPMALSYGINMQYGEGRDVIYLGLPDSLELYLQLNARLWRQGVTSAVRIHRILASGTVDEMVRDRTDNKQDVQATFLEALKAYRIQKMMIS